MPEALSLSGVAADLQGYAYDHKEHLVSRIAEIGLEGRPGTPIKALADYVNVMECDGIQSIVLTDLDTVDPLQPGNKDEFNPKAYGTLKNRTMTSRPIKVDMKYSQSQIHKLYSTYMMKVRMKRFDPKVVPFEEWVMVRLAEDIQKNLRIAFYNSIYDADGTDSGDIMDGVLDQITDIIAAAPTTTNAVALGSALTLATVRAKFDILKAALPAKVRYGADTVMILNTAAYDLYCQAYQKEVTASPYNTEFGKTFLEGTQVEMIVEPGVEAFARPIIATKDNLAMMLDFNRLAEFEFYYNKETRAISVMLDFYGNAGIANPKDLWIGGFTA
ncbi:hypothetical protein MCERE19_02247 [Spirosomataceae bacterium]|jgi:hypothetical protein